MEFNQPEVTLGVHVCANGSNSGTIEHLSKESTTWVSQIKASFLYRWETSLALMTTLARIWACPLLVTTMTEDECEKILRPVYKEILPKTGVNKHIPRVYRFAPKALGGIEMSHLYWMQGISHVEGLLFHMHKDTLVGGLLKAQFEQCSLEIGVGKHILSLPFDKYGCLLTDCWVKNTWKFCWENAIEIRGEYELPTLHRDRYFFLMEELIETASNILTKKEIRSINKCRIYLKCVTATDIYSADG